MQKILFVCLGNICRSPMAEAIGRNEIEKAGLQKEISVGSAATSRWEQGNKPHKGTRIILDQLGISYEGIHSTQISPTDFKEYDYILGMDTSIVRELQSIAPKGTGPKIHLFMDSVAGKEGLEVPDPYYTGDFNQTLSLVAEGIEAWLTYIQKENQN